MALSLNASVDTSLKHRGDAGGGGGVATVPGVPATAAPRALGGVEGKGEGTCCVVISCCELMVRKDFLNSSLAVVVPCAPVTSASR